jgi:2-(1,2-epoxy-1,2-dihydrophenyl)acetyl-CoA isomerase
MKEKPKKLVLTNVENNVGNIIFNRPEHLNAFNLDLANQFLNIIKLFNDDESIRAIVIRGNGNVFSAGGDIKEMYSDVQENKDNAAYFRAPLAAFNKMTLSITKTPKPVIAAVHGAVAGVAFNLMLGCDFRIAKEGTRFAQAFVKIGLSPDGGGTYFLPRLVGYARACELSMLPTEIDAKTAFEWGLINRVFSADTFEIEVKNTANKLAEGPSLAIGQMKSLLNKSYDRTLAEQMEAERLAQIKNTVSDNFEEGLKAFIEKRQARFHS